MSRSLLALRLSVFLGLFAVSSAVANDYREARAELIAAYQSKNYPAMTLAAQKTLAARPGFPGALFNFALTQTLNGDHEGALQTLNGLLDKGVDFGASELEDFAALHELEGWVDYVTREASLKAAVGDVEQALRLNADRFIPEGVALDAGGDVYLGSVHRGLLIRSGKKPNVFLENAPSWSVFGMRFHGDGSLWFASAAVPQFKDVGEDEGKTGLFRINPDTGEMLKSAVLPHDEESQVLGDLIIADDNTIYATDSLTGAVYRYHIDSNEFETLVERGQLGSPQGLTLDATGRFLYVADYTGGLYRVSLEDGSFSRMNIAQDVTDYGIDGLYRHGNELIAIVNGNRPHRVVALDLDKSGSAVVSSRVLAANLEEFDEPTLGLVNGDEFLFVANSHWNRFDQDNNLPDGLAGPLVLKLPLN